MKKYKVRIEVPGKVIFFNNRKIRSPFELELADNEIDLFKLTMTSNGISKYTIEDIEDIKEDDKNTWEEIIAVKDAEVVIEDLYIEEDEPNTILEKLLRDERNGE